MSSRRRMSLGGGALRRSALADQSSRVNSVSNHFHYSSTQDTEYGTAAKPSYGTPAKPSSIQIDDGNGIGLSSSKCQSSSVPRRQSLGGIGLPSRCNQSHGNTNMHASGETPIRDRRAMLDAWRKARGLEATNTSLSVDDASSIEPRKRSRGDLRLPPSFKHHRTASSQDNASSGCTSQMKQGPSDVRLQQDVHPSINNYHYDDDIENRYTVSTLTPSNRPGSLRKSLMCRSNTNHTGEDENLDDPSSQQTQENDVDASMLFNYEQADLVEDAGILSQMERMKQRVEQLEKEKMNLSMSKAPLEARFRQKEDAWQKEKSSLLDQIEDSKASLRVADEKYRDLQEQYDQASEEVSQLRQEVRKASSSRPTSGLGAPASNNSGLWTRQLQNDRDLAEMKEKLRSAEEEISGIRLAKVSLEKELHATRIELSCLERNYDELKAEYDVIAAHTSENNEAEIKLKVLTEEHIATTAALNAVYVDLDATKARAEAAMKEKNDTHKKEMEQLQFDLSVMKTRAGKINLDVSSTHQPSDEEDEAVLRARIEERDKRIAELEAELWNGEQLRRQMHNTIQELRGNIRVYVRTRPFLPGDQQIEDSPIDVSPDGESLVILDRRSGAPLDFKFDRVFPPSAGQEFVFDEVSDFVQSALDGYNVCLFSYGQTGSGKTHTMQGCGSGPMRGIIPRSVEQILDQARCLNRHKWNFTVTASFLEIYNETLKDLLTSMRTSKSSRSSDKLSIKRSREGKSYVEGLTEISIDVQNALAGIEELESLMKVAARSRSVASTRMNSQSSRSHSVFILHLNGYNDESGAIVNGTLNLCDLAGSERLDRSGAGADAQRLRETQSINKSLSCLGDVFNALATGASHIPYRNSKLTYLLQDCLSGDGKALMFVNLSPTTASCGESVCSLRFAQRVNQVELGKATKHIEYGSKGRR